MRSGILRTYAATLRLRRYAPFPSELARARRRYLRLRVMPNGGSTAAEALKTVG